MNLILTIALAALAGQVGPTPVSCCEGESIAVGGSSILELVDQDGNLTIHDVRAPSMASGWTLNTNGVPSRGYSSEARWFWFSTINNTPEHQFIVLEIGWPVMNEVDVYIVGRSGDEPEQVSHYSSGSGRPFELRPLPYHHLAVPHELSPGERADVYTRIKTNTPMQFPVRIHKEASFHGVASTSGTMWGVYFGFMLLIAVYNLVLFMVLRETSHLYLSLFVVCLAGLQAAFSGHIQQYLFPSSPAANLVALPIFLNATLLTGILFTMRFLELRETARNFHWFFLSLGAMAGINLVVVTFISQGTSIALGNILAIPLCLGAIAAGWYLSLKGHSSAKIYSLAWVLFLLGATALALNKLGILAYNVVTEYGWSLGAMFKAVLLSLALAYSIEKLKNQQEEIRGLVTQRTAELKEQTQAALSAREEAEAARQEAEELRKEAEQNAEKLEILDKHKTAFFQNVSHELRTPLTLILNPLDQATKELPGNRNIEVAAKNARRLLRLVNQLLDFQKLEAGKKELRLEPINLVYFAYISGSYFRSACASKNIMTDVIFAHGGTIDKFIGDAIMVIFGAPSPLSPEDQAERATRCAQEMQAAMVDLSRAWTAEGILDFKMRIGIHHGPVVVGNFGSDKRSEYTAIGPTVNLASRIESLCEPGQIFISGTLCDYLPEERAELVGEFEMKGVKGKRHIYRLLDS